MLTITRWTTAAAMLAAVSIAGAQPTAAQKCEGLKNLAAGKYALCRQRAQKVLVFTGDAGRYGQIINRCDQRLLSKWTTLEADSPGACPTTGDQADMQSYVTEHADRVAQALGGVGLPRCGDGVINTFSEQCDGAALGGATCVSLGFVSGPLFCDASCHFDTNDCVRPECPATGQTTCWDSSGATISCPGTGHDGEVQAGGTLTYVDNGDGTITDLNTGLMWEKKSDDGGIHDKDTTYQWSDAFAVHVVTLNSTLFAGYNDWRLPNEKELVGIVNFEIPFPGPTVSPAFNTGCAPACTVLTCSCTEPGTYWSATTYASTPAYAWGVFFGDSDPNVNGKLFPLLVRAVRGT
jgi:hypothetical protein